MIFFRKIFKIILILVSVLVFLESVFIVINQFTVCPAFYDKRYKKYWSKPNSYDYNFRINSQGFKDLEFKKDKEDGTYRITAVGDSFAFGTVPYRYNYLTLLEKNLNVTRDKYEVYNFGEPSIGPHDYVSILVHECLRYHPDMVLVCITLADDLGKRKRHTYLYITSLVKYIIDSMKNYEGIIVHGKMEYTDNMQSMPKEMYLDYVVSKSDIYLESNRDDLKKMYKNTLYYLEKMRDICREKEIIMVVALMNSEMQVDETLQKKIARKMNVSLAELDFSMPNRFLRNALGEMGIPVVDILDDFLEVSRATGKQYYITRNLHYNIAGNRLAARLLKEKLLPAIKEDRE